MDSAGNIAFTTIHGSRLYGLSHDDSDRDSMIVYMDGRQAKNIKKGEEDIIHVGITTLIEKAESGAHQFLEGLFSQQKQWHNDDWKPMIENVRIPPALIAAKYERTIKRLCFDDFKRRRHAVRLFCGLSDMRLNNSGRFNPTLSEEDVEFTGYMATLYKNWDLAEFLLPHLRIT